MADIKVSWLQLDTSATPVDVRVSWLQLDTAATPCDVRVSWLQLDTAGQTTVALDPPRYYSVGGMTEQHRRRLVEEDETLLAILQMFVMEEA